MKRSSTEQAADPHSLARNYLRERASTKHGKALLRHWREKWWHYDGSRYQRITNQTVSNDVTRFVKSRFDRLRAADSKNRRLAVRKGLIENVLNALRAECEIHEHVFEDYVGSCLRQGYKPLDVREFGKEVTRKFPRANRRRIRGEYHDC